MKFRKHKKGFTIVELIIVIAVIGVLTAVLVPTFVHLVNKANKASDEALVSNLNKAVQLRYAETNKKPETMHETVEGLREYGYNVDALVAKSNESLLYDLDGNKFYLEGSSEVDSSKPLKYWRIQDNLTEQKYSIYAGPKFSATNIQNLNVGFDVGSHTNISSIEYQPTTNASEKVILRTNGGALEVDASQGSMKHYGNLDTLNVIAIKKGSYHEHGAVVNGASLTAGKIVVEKEGYIKQITLDATATNATAEVAVEGYVNTVDSSAITAEENKVTATGAGYVVHNGNSSAAAMGQAGDASMQIRTIADLHLFRDRVNSGAWDANLIATLEEDLDLTGAAWAPIGKKAFPFVGTFDGKNHTIKGLTNAGYSIDTNDVFITNHSGNQGIAYGFFGVIGGAENVTIQNLKLEDIDFDMEWAGALGGLFGANLHAADSSKSGAGNIMIKNISVSGKLSSANEKGLSAGGIGGKVYTFGRLDVINCKNYANIELGETANKAIKVSGIIGFFSNTSNSDSTTLAVIDDCHNYGNITANSGTALIYAAGIITKGWGACYVKNSSTQGVTTLTGSGICYSVIARMQDHEVIVLNADVEFESSHYKQYRLETVTLEPTSVFIGGCSISSESDFDAFSTRINDGESHRTIENSLGLDYGFLL